MMTNSEKRASIRRVLLCRSEQLCSNSDQSGLGVVLRGFLPTLERAFILRWVPEQAEDIYWVLTSPTEIVIVEIPRSQPSDDERTSLQTIGVAMFRQKRLSRETRERLEIALELMSV